MALIKCPECGREGVSDSAKACPQCGFDVSKYITNQICTKQEKSIEMQNTKILKTKESNLNNHINSASSDEESAKSVIGHTYLYGGLLLTIFIFILYFYIGNPLLIILDIFISGYSLYKFATYCPEEHNQIMEKQQRKNQARKYAPECPVCHSHHTQKISLLSRSVSVELMGLASDTIGKQYICMDCKHKW